MSTKKKLLLIAPFARVGMALFIAAGGWVVMALWNWLTPALFESRTITFWLALGLLALCRIRFGGFSLHGRDAERVSRRVGGPDQLFYNRRQMHIAHVLLLALFVQAPPASVEGTVTKMGSGEPLAAATVELHPEKTGAPELVPGRPREYFAATSQDGRFALNGVAPGTYRLTATRSGGYVPAEYGQRSPTTQGIPFEIAAGQRITGIQLAMSPTGSITGRVYDRDGEPLGKAQVQALRMVYKEGRRALTGVQSVETNDRGEYRLFWLTPGQYYVSAKPDIPQLPLSFSSPDSATLSVVHVSEPSRIGGFEQASSPVIRKRRTQSGEMVEETSVPVYYPGVVESQAASAIPVAAGAVINGIDISIGAGIVPARHIRGRAIGAIDGQPLANANVTAYTSGPSLSLPTAQSDSNGFFDLEGVTAGSYQVLASSGRVNGTTVVEVGSADVQNIAIIARPGFSLKGKFVLDGRSPTGAEPKFADLRVGAFVREPATFGMNSAGPSFNPPPEPDGSFKLDGVETGDFRVTLRGVPTDAYVKSIRLGNADVLDAGLHLTGPPENPLEIVIGLNAGRISGSVVNERQEPLSNRTVVLVPDVRLRHRADLYRIANTDNAGRFRFQGITPGTYRLFAWDEVENGAWRDPDFLRLYESRGKPVQVNEGGDENVQLTVIPPDRELRR